MTATQQETIDPLHALAHCLIGIEQQLADVNTRLTAIEARPTQPTPPLAELEGLQQVVRDIEQTWASTGLLVDTARALNSRMGELTTSVELALVALPVRRRVLAYRTRQQRQDVRWATTGD